MLFQSFFKFMMFTVAPADRPIVDKIIKSLKESEKVIIHITKQIENCVTKYKFDANFIFVQLQNFVFDTFSNFESSSRCHFQIF